MARKLFGAAAKAHARKLARVKRSAAGRRRRKRSTSRVTRRRRRRSSAPRARRTRRRRRNPWVHSFAGGKSTWHNVPAPAGRLARIKARHQAMTSAAAPRKRRRRSSSRRRRRIGGRPSTVRSMRRARRTLRNRYITRSGKAYKRRYRMRSNPTRRRRRGRRNPRYTTPKSLRRARRTIRNRRMTGYARAYKRRYRMRSNPVTAASMTGAFTQTIKAAVPIAVALYGARALSYAVAPRLPLFDRIPARWQGTAMAVLLGGLGFIATRKIARLRPHAGAVMIGLGLNLLDNALSALAPASIKARIGLGDYIEVGDVYSDGLGARPLWDGQMDGYETVGDYVEVGNDGLQEELGVEEELGLEEELGSSVAYLGGVRQDMMLKQVPSRPMLAAVPDRSFTQQVPRAGAAYDNPSGLYGGIFAGGFGG